MISISMSKFTILIILVAILAAQQAASQAPTKPTYFTEFCRSKMGNYTTNSTYEDNVLTVLTDLYAQSSNASFANTSAGSASASQVFGQYYCRGDINSSLCNDCIKEAAQTVYVKCHNFKSAVVWYEECTLRYDNMSMVGVEAERPISYVYSAANVTDPDKFGTVVNETIDGLISETARGGNSSFFATGEGVVSQFETAYCLVQCSPDLNGTECDTCLHSAYGDFIPQWWPQFAFVFSPSCQLRYSTQGAFYEVQSAPPPEATAPPLSSPPSASPPPPPMTTASPPSGGSAELRSRESFNLGLPPPPPTMGISPTFMSVLENSATSATRSSGTNLQLLPLMTISFVTSGISPPATVTTSANPHMRVLGNLIRHPLSSAEGSMVASSCADDPSTEDGVIAGWAGGALVGSILGEAWLSFFPLRLDSGTN
ncbi:hypothetical protein V2J09_020912 [Rumex salicifolius]